MSNIQWPEVAIPRDFTLGRYTKVVRNSAIFGRKGQNVDLLNDRWFASVDISARDQDASPVLEAFVNKLKSGANTVECYHFARPEVSGTLLSGVTTTYSAIGSDTVILQVQTGSTLKSGDMLGLNGQLVQLAFDAEATDGLLTAILTTRLRKTVSAGLTVVTSKPTAKFKLGGRHSTTYGPNATIRGLSLELLEDIT